jgi:hypothetical protein
LNKAGFVIGLIIFIIGIIYVVIPSYNEMKLAQKDADIAKQKEKQANIEVQKAYDKCVKVAEKSQCDAIVANNPTVKRHD